KKFNDEQIYHDISAIEDAGYSITAIVRHRRHHRQYHDDPPPFNS
ncbi:unnamed protein product, partial [Brassica oleracea var. botrytis]